MILVSLEARAPLVSSSAVPLSNPLADRVAIVCHYSIQDRKGWEHDTEAL